MLPVSLEPAHALRRRVWLYEQLDYLTHDAATAELPPLLLRIALRLMSAAAGTLILNEQVVAAHGLTPPTPPDIEYPLLRGSTVGGRLCLWQASEGDDSELLELLSLLVRRWTTTWNAREQAVMARTREVRLQALLDISGLITSTLDRERLLQRILTYACTLLQAEVASIFLLEETTGDLILRIATGATAEQVREVRVPQGKGIAGFVAETGETVLVNDPAHDPRFYDRVDKQTQFQTRTLICVPLRTRAIQLGDALGTTEERIVGVVQVLNRVDGLPFSAEDVALCESLGSQAATVLEIAGLYANMHELFTDVIEAITTAIDAKDPYTQGHSRRVAAYASEIARELGQPAEFVRRVRISGILHDVGKIGVPDAVLKKPAPLDDDEYALMKEHPVIGGKIMGAVRLLKHELPGLLEHHERPDGRGYPNGLTELSLLGRIIAVADSFDAMTSDRAYRAALDIEEVWERLHAGAGTQWDAACVAALWHAYEAGHLRMTQVNNE